MANLEEKNKWENGIYRIEEDDPVLGGEDGISNKAAKQLANRTLYLKNTIENLDNDVIHNSKKSDAVNSASQDTVATSKAVKTTYDKAKEIADTAFLYKNKTVRSIAEILKLEDGIYKVVASDFPNQYGNLIVTSNYESKNFNGEKQSSVNWKSYEFLSVRHKRYIGTSVNGGEFSGFTEVFTEKSPQVMRTDKNNAINGHIIFKSKSKSLCGVYDPQKIAQIWSMGIDYKVPDDGSSFGNLYGFAYKCSGTEMAKGHQAIWCNDGTPLVALGRNLWVKNAADVQGKVKTPVIEFSNGGVLKTYDNDWVHLSKKLYLTNKEAHSIYADGGIFAKKGVETDGYIESRGGISTRKSKSEFLNSWKYAIELLDGDSIIGFKGANLGIGFNSNGNLQLVHRDGGYVATFGENGDSIFNNFFANKIHINNQNTDDRYVKTSDFKIAELTTENLNTITANGFYAQKSSSNASQSLNYPTQEAGTLIVMPSAHIVRQEYRTYASGTVFFRNSNSDGSWRPWKKINAEVKILTGNIKHGGVIPLPAGYTQEQCKWMVTPHKMWDNISSNDMLGFQTYVDENRVVTCLVENSVSDMSSADYIIIGVK
ncbi:pyocin knob domain-containing protein [Pasteurella skyensis]|uniref:Pyocin knob domain-containing protein n=1 Tax=Phocoenobacter skyensis TaxID=97481 RepID=A0AAJ6P0I8_9PAST|nr:pyocin knob domain-containing protein [Pasteurella skyensis]MDP8162793.1 pyocin knob domain-containing protein [Pasteurella skyensis]MDP8172620.1 pyocin knob domain-containing protein [Pasteurella skyensis]MDP8179120.1 pyocin knob domain-containing protein [Pasteurella skyensis]MDP8183195.1 pyocin knob domain-containing protein [Pasteurella skyensis]MDP8189246.1 pyocin knob domain-containing protein [Pasteurella skyensis]